jgi:hypothetical protein
MTFLDELAIRAMEHHIIEVVQGRDFWLSRSIGIAIGESVLS